MPNMKSPVPALEPASNTQESFKKVLCGLDRPVDARLRRAHVRMVANGNEARTPAPGHPNTRAMQKCRRPDFSGLRAS
jgi:hypothetical protein